jgi:hypothetical protein
METECIVRFELHFWTLVTQNLCFKGWNGKVINVYLSSLADLFI